MALYALCNCQCLVSPSLNACVSVANAHPGILHLSWSQRRQSCSCCKCDSNEGGANGILPQTDLKKSRDGARLQQADRDALPPILHHASDPATFTFSCIP